MSPRERVLKAWRRLSGTPDRVPVQFDLSRNLLEHFGKKLGIPVEYTCNLYEDVTYRISGNEIRTAMGSDVVVTGAGTPGGFRVERAADGTWLNEYGMRVRQGEIYAEIIEYPLARVATPEDVAAYRFPDPLAAGRYGDAERLIQRYQNEYLIIGNIEVTIFSLAQQLVGMEKFLMDMAMGAEYIEPLLRACTEFQSAIGLRLIQMGADALWAGDDFGTQKGLLFSPGMFRRMVKPHYQRMNRAFREAKPDILLILHCDGAVSPLLNDFWEMGYEVFNPVQPGVPGHDPATLKQKFGDKLCFWGAIDQQDLLPRGGDEELEADIREKIGILGKNRGYMIAPAHILQTDVSPARVEKFVELCLTHGRYS
jgi:uroporphyrinogen decarboxylase